VTFFEKTVRSTAFIAYRSSIRSYRLREEARAPETCPGPGGNAAAARTGTRTGARAGTDARAGTCEAREEVITCGNDQLEILSRPPSGGLFFDESKGWSRTGCKGRLGFKNILIPRTWPQTTDRFTERGRNKEHSRLSSVSSVTNNTFNSFLYTSL
jgi:hypothetical protein